MGIKLTPEEMFNVFGDYDPSDHAAEAAQRWGSTPAHEQSARRTSSYEKDDWERMRAETIEIEQQFASVMHARLPSDSPAAMEAAEAHRASISRWFYDCDHTMHRGLGDMYVADARFAAHYEAVAPDLAHFVRDAIHANADRAEAGTQEG